MPQMTPQVTVADPGYRQRRGQIADYFERTAVEAWARLTSDAPVSGIRATVRAGRDEMRATLLDWLPQDLAGRRILDAGCGTGALSVELARRGARVVAIDLSPTLVDLARERCPAELSGQIDFCAGDMLDAGLGEFDDVTCMDSLIHYEPPQAVAALAALVQRTRGDLLFTFAPANAWLMPLIALGRLFPKADRAPSIVPVRPERLAQLISAEPALAGWAPVRSRRVARGFYTSHALLLRQEVRRP
jgi:magnesium-protoporphyrin O-methyltransferase